VAVTQRKPSTVVKCICGNKVGTDRLWRRAVDRCTLGTAFKMAKVAKEGTKLGKNTAYVVRNAIKLMTKAE